MSASKWSRASASSSPVRTCWRTRKAGTRSRVRWVTTPRAPRATTVAVEAVAVAVAAEGDGVAVGGDQVEGAYRGGQRAVAVARAVGAGGDGAGHRDVRQGREVGQREAVRVQYGGEFGVAHPGGDADGGGGGVDVHLRRERAEFDQVAVGVGDVVEGVAAAEGLDPAGAGDEPAQFAEGGRSVHALRGEGQVGRPVGSHRPPLVTLSAEPPWSRPFAPYKARRQEGGGGVRAHCGGRIRGIRQRCDEGHTVRGRRASDGAITRVARREVLAMAA